MTNTILLRGVTPPIPTPFDTDGNVALSAYNGGPGNASGWYALAPDDPDFYLEIITLSEPRLYIQQIYTHYTYYRALYGEP